MILKNYNKNITREIIDFAWPIFISSIFQELYNMTNSAIVGKFVSLQALSAVSACTWICNVFSYMFFGIGLGAGVVTSRNYGAKDEEKLKTSIDTALIFGLVGGVILTILAEIFMPLLMKISNINVDIYDIAKSYLRVYFLGSAFVFTYNMCFNIMRCFGETKSLLYYSIISSLINLVFGIVLVRFFNLNVIGTSIATIISQFVSMVCCLSYLIRTGRINLKFKELHFSFKMIGSMCKIGIPAGIQNLLIALSSMMVQSQVNLFSNEVIAGIGVGEKVANWGQKVSNAFSSGCVMSVSRYLGAKEYEKVQESIKQSLILSTIFNTLVIIILFVAAPYAGAIFNDDAQVMAYACKMIRYTLVGDFLLNFSHIYNSSCRGAGNVKVPMIIAILTQAFGKYIFVTLALKIKFDVQIIYLGNMIGFGLAGIVATLYFNLTPWTRENHLRK